MNSWNIYASIFTLLIVAACILFLVFSWKRYRPTNFLAINATPIGLSIILLTIASSQVIYGYQVEPEQTYEKVELYKVFHWLEKDTADLALEKAKEIWNREGSSDAKYALALSYLHNGHVLKGEHLLQELAKKSDGLSLVSKKEFSIIKNEAERANHQIEVTSSEVIDQYIQVAKEQTVKQLKKKKREDLEYLAILDRDYVGHVYAVGDDNAKQQIIDTYEDLKEQRVSYEVKRNIANVAYFFEDYDIAENRLLELANEEKLDLYSSLLVSELYLNEHVPISEQIKSLPQFTYADRRAEKKQREDAKVWLNELVEQNFKESEEVIQERLQNIDQNLTPLSQEIAYTFLLPYQYANIPETNFALSKYYFYSGNESKSANYIEQLKQNPQNLSPKQQYYLNNLIQLPLDPYDLTEDVLENRHQNIKGAYRAFNPIPSHQKWGVRELADQERSYQTFFSNEMMNLKKERIHISSIHPNKDGTIELFVWAENIEELDKKNLTIQDNGKPITKFTLEKVSEIKNHQRNIMLVIDHSTSMEGERFDIAKHAAKNFIRNKTGNEQIGILAFDSGNYLVHPQSKNHTSLIRSIDTIPIGGGTDVTQAIYVAFDHLQDNPGERILFILSDGEDSNFESAKTRRTIIHNANERGFTIFSIGFGAGYETLRDISEGTGGRYLTVNSSEGLLRSFNEISETLQRTYKITYHLDNLTPGKHTVRIETKQKHRAIRSYIIEGEPQDDDNPVATPPEQLAFSIIEISPNQIIQSNTGETEITIIGEGFEHVKEVKLFEKKVNFNRINNQKLNFKVKNNQLELGQHQISLIDGSGNSISGLLTVRKSEAQVEVRFGWATIYGDFLEEDSGKLTVIGNTSVDHFIIDKNQKMVLSDGNSRLTFDGFRVLMDSQSIPVLQSKSIEETVSFFQEINQTITMKKEQENIFSLNYSSSWPAFSKFGLQFDLKRDMKYSLKKPSVPGEITMQMGIKGFGKVTGLLKTPDIKTLNSLFKFTKHNYGLTVTYAPQELRIVGEVPVFFQSNKFIQAETTAKVDYSYATGTFILKGKASNFKIFGSSLNIGKIGIDSISLELGWYNELLPKRFGIEFASKSKGIPIGVTGLILNKIGLTVDFAKVGGEVTVGIGTIAEFVHDFIDMMNQIPFVEIPHNICFLCFDGKLGIYGLGSHAWSLNGGLNLILFGFDIGEANGLFTPDAINLNFHSDLGLHGSTIITWEHPHFGNKTVIYIHSTADIFWQEGMVRILLIPASIRDSAVEYRVNLLGLEVVFEYGEIDNLVIVR